MKLREYAERHGISPSTARRRAQRGQIPGARKVPGGVREDGTVYHAYWEVPDGEQGEQDTDNSGGSSYRFQLAREATCPTEQSRTAGQQQTDAEDPPETPGAPTEESSLTGILVILGLGLLAQVFGRK